MRYKVLIQPAYESFAEFLSEGEKHKFDMVAGPVNPWEIPHEFEEEPLCSKQNDFTYPDLALNPAQWSQKFLTILSEEIDCDSEDPKIRKNSEKVLEKDLSWVAHIQSYGYSMISLKSPNNINLARNLSSYDKAQFLVKVPAYNPRMIQSSYRRDVNEEYLEEIQKDDTWHWWHDFYKALNFNPKIKLALELHESYIPTLTEVRRWLGEPVEAVILPKSMFVRNKNYFPVLRVQWKAIVYYFLHAKVNVILSAGIDDEKIPERLEYIMQLGKGLDEKHIFNGYEDILEVPLQPLYDNLDCFTYDTFEHDPIKYKLYQDAIEAALVDRVSDEEKFSKITIIMLLGGGRGPLARACLNASEKTGRRIRLYIIEKNPNAIRTLQSVINKLWSKKDVHLFSKDMRELKPPEKADILVSELLGSFGDNELSPECLDISLEILKPDGISIPSKSTSFINPVSSQKLLNVIRTAEALRTKTIKANECPYVVLLKDCFHIDFPKILFEFIHPNYEKPIDNTRYRTIKFKAPIDCMMTGLGGFFEAVLYKNIIISNNIETHTPGMSSWFPMYFPFSEPIELREGDTIEVHFWRCCSKEKVWYEWSLAKPTVTHTHNLKGESQAIRC